MTSFMTSFKDLRKYRFLSFSAIDLFGTFIIAIIILKIISLKIDINFNIKNIFIICFLSIILAIVTHKIFDVNTQLNYDLGLSGRPDI